MSGRILVRVLSGPDAGLTRAVTGRCEVGRGADADLRLSDPAVSRRHAILEPRDGALVLVDTGSAAGTRLNGKRVTTTVLAPPGATVKVGETVLLVLVERLAPPRGGSRFVVVPEGDEALPVPLAGELMLGRDRASDVRVDHSSVSRRHAMLRESAGTVLLTDLDSPNGTRVNGQVVRGERRVLPGDGITLGTAPTVLTIEAAGSRGVATHQVNVRSETSPSSCGVSISAPPDATVDAVVAEVATFLGLRAGHLTRWRGYVQSSGTLLAGADRWSDLPLPRGELLTIAAFADLPGPVTAPDRQPARAQWASPPDPTVNTPPRTTAPPAPRELRAPMLPEGTELKGRGVLWQVAAGGVAVVAAAVVAVRFPQAMLFAVVAAVAGLATVAFGLLGDQSRRRHGVRTFETELAALEASLADCAATHADTWRGLSPDRDTMRSWVR